MYHYNHLNDIIGVTRFLSLLSSSSQHLCTDSYTQHYKHLQNTYVLLIKTGDRSECGSDAAWKNKGERFIVVLDPDLETSFFFFATFLKSFLNGKEP